MVSKILRSKHKYLDQDIGREPPTVDLAQSKISKPLEQLDEPAPWSSWSEITAAGSHAMASMQARPQSSPNSPPESGFSSVAPSRPGSPGGSQAGDNNGVSTTCTNCCTQTTPLWRCNPAFSQDRSISPPMSSPFVPARVPSPPPGSDTQSEQYPIVQQARHEDDSMHNGILINGERYACKVCYDEDRVSGCQHTGR